MEDKKLRKAIDEYGKEMEEEIILLSNSSFDKSIIGMTEDCRIVYDYEKMIHEFMEDEQCDEIEAIEWLEHNTLPAIGYMGDRRPIIVYTNKEELLDKYVGE